MKLWLPKCPRCRSQDLEPHIAVDEASDRSENVETTHRCLKCGTVFRVVPPDRPEVWP